MESWLIKKCLVVETSLDVIYILQVFIYPSNFNVCNKAQKTSNVFQCPASHNDMAVYLMY